MHGAPVLVLGLVLVGGGGVVLGTVAACAVSEGALLGSGVLGGGRSAGPHATSKTMGPSTLRIVVNRNTVRVKIRARASALE